ncbi:MAG: hypothetical protein GPJ54_06935 [Candidatus Heimdallarchaeota archaeon]|nr:hypothetical protein [Candidatus Heimdallarchaeota archaeon]
MHSKQNYDEKLNFSRRIVITPSGDYVTKREYRNNGGIIYDRRIVINPSGEYVTQYQPMRVVHSSNFELPIPTITKMELMKELLYPDKFELFLLFISFVLNVIFTGTLTGVSPLNPNMIVFWGIINFILTTTRWAYWGPIHFQAKMKLLDQELMKGNIVVDFKLFGILASLLLIIIGVTFA